MNAQLPAEGIMKQMIGETAESTELRVTVMTKHIIITCG